MKRIFTYLLAAVTGVTMAHAQTTKSYDLFVGTYTNASKSNGIHIYSFDSGTGTLTQRSVTTGISNPSYLNLSKDNKYVYAISEVGRGQAKIHAYSYDRASGNLNAINSVPAGGDGPCYVSVDPKGKYVFAGMYSSGSLSATPANKDGSLAANSQVLKYEGSSINKQNQSRPHVHAAILSPDGKYLFATDLGTDKIYGYRYESGKSTPLSTTAQGAVVVKPGSGPRHLVFHPNGKYVYGVMELSAEVAVMKYKNGNLSVAQYITMLPDGFKGEVEAADIHVSPDGRFLYASNRADGNDIVIYSIDAKGKLTYTGRQKEHIRTPRGFAIDPSGNYVVVANMDGNNVVVFKRDQTTGMLTATGIEAQVDEPVCLKFTN